LASNGSTTFAAVNDSALPATPVDYTGSVTTVIDAVENATGEMKAAVLHEVGGIPRYEEFPDPVAGEDEVIIDVKAVAVENVDKMIAAGTHYASGRYISQLPAIPGFDGV